MCCQNACSTSSFNLTRDSDGVSSARPPASTQRNVRAPPVAAHGLPRRARNGESGLGWGLGRQFSRFRLPRAPAAAVRSTDSPIGIAPSGPSPRRAPVLNFTKASTSCPQHRDSATAYGRPPDALRYFCFLFQRALPGRVVVRTQKRARTEGVNCDATLTEMSEAY